MHRVESEPDRAPKPELRAKSDWREGQRSEVLARAGANLALRLEKFPLSATALNKNQRPIVRLGESQFEEAVADSEAVFAVVLQSPIDRFDH